MQRTHPEMPVVIPGAQKSCVIIADSAVQSDNFFDINQTFFCEFLKKSSGGREIIYRAKLPVEAAGL